jgi:hypothetical protein
MNCKKIYVICEYAKLKMWKSREEMAEEGIIIVNMIRKNRRTDCIRRAREED